MQQQRAHSVSLDPAGSIAETMLSAAAFNKCTVANDSSEGPLAPSDLLK